MMAVTGSAKTASGSTERDVRAGYFLEQVARHLAMLHLRFD